MRFPWQKQITQDDESDWSLLCALSLDLEQVSWKLLFQTLSNANCIVACLQTLISSAKKPRNQAERQQSSARNETWNEASHKTYSRLSELITSTRQWVLKPRSTKADEYCKPHAAKQCKYTHFICHRHSEKAGFGLRPYLCPSWWFTFMYWFRINYWWQVD